MKNVIFALSLALAMPFATTGCADENDPATWVKRLDDPAQRTAAIKRLAQFYEDALTSDGNKRDGEHVKKVGDVIVEPLTKTYTAGGLDDKTRKDLVKALSNMKDPRTQPALAKALSEYEPGKTDEDVKFAAEGAGQLAKQGVKLDKTVVDGLWACFIKYQPSKTNSIQGTQALHDSILAVKDPSYGDKAIIALKAPVTLDDSVSDKGTKKVNDQIEFWQTTAVQVIKALRYKPAAKALVAVVMTHNKIGIATVAKSAIMTMPNDAEPFLAAALNGSDPELAKLGADWSQDNGDPQYHGYILNLIDVLGYTALDSARDAIIAYIPSIDTDQNRAAAVKMLVWFTASPQTIATYKTVYTGLPPIADKAGTDTGSERAGLLSIASQFFEASLGSWALSQASTAKGTSMLAAKAGALQSAIKVMGPGDKKAVEAGLANLDASGLNAQEKKDAADIHLVYKFASEALDKCALDAGCYVKVLEDPVGQTPNANWKAIKAAHMAGLLGNDATRKDLIAHVTKVTNPGARLAMAVAINHLAPKGDVADADALDKIVADDTARKDNEALKGDDALSKVALMLRARASQ
jgi:hypothetical protein